MCIVCLGDDSDEMSTLIVSEKKKNSLTILLATLNVELNISQSS